MQETLTEFFKYQDRFLQNLKTEGKGENTIKNYKTDLACFIRFLDSIQSGFSTDKSLELSLVKEYAGFVDKSYKSTNSRRRRIQTLRIFCDFLQNLGLIDSNPVKAIPVSPKFLDIPRPPSKENIIKFWNHLKGLEQTTTEDLPSLIILRNQMVFLLIYGAALKVSDLANLKRGQIFTHTNPRIMIIPESRTPYSIPLPSSFNQIFDRYITKLSYLKTKMNLEFEELLFNANPYRILAGGLGARGLEILFEDYRKELDLNITPRSLRQACIYKWMLKNIKDSIIKEWLGVAPSYSLKGYRDYIEDKSYSDDFLEAVH